MGAVKNYYHDEICARDADDSYGDLETSAAIASWRGGGAKPLPFWPSEKQSGKPLHPAVLHQPKTCSRCGKQFLFWHRFEGNWRLHHYADVGAGPQFILHRCGLDSAGRPVSAQAGVTRTGGDGEAGSGAVGPSTRSEGCAPTSSPKDSNHD